MTIFSNNSRFAAPKTMRVLHVTGTLNRGGVETWLSQILVRLPRERYQCDICTYRLEGGAYANMLKDHGCMIYFIPHHFSPGGFLRFGRSLKQLLRDGRYEVVHCHGLLLVGFILFVAWSAKIPVRIGHSHNTDRSTVSNFTSAVTALLLKLNRFLARAFSTRGVGCSEEAQDALFGPTWRQTVSKYSIIHCGIDLTRFEGTKNRHLFRESIGIPPDVKVIGHVSNLGVAKNPQFLIELADYVFRRRHDVWMLIVGDGVLRQHIERMCADRGIRSRVVFAGLRPDVPDLMRFAMDIFVMPSVHEGLPLVLLEAQAAGLPCIVSDAVSREAQVSENTVQFLALATGPSSWGEKILLQFEPPSLRSTAIEAMKETDFNICISASRLGDLYDVQVP